MADQNIRSSDPDATWQVQDAKARFSELLDASHSEGPQIITRRGAEIAAVVPIEQWRRLEAAVPSLKELLLDPGAIAGVPTPRDRDRDRDRHPRPADRLERPEPALYLLNADVIVALIRPTPDRAVLDWITGVPANRLHISAMAIGEIQMIIEETKAKDTADNTAQDTLKAQALEEWLLRLRCAYGVMVADAVTFREWGRLMHRRPETALDVAMLASTALVHRLTVVTGYGDCFEPLGVPTVNPFEPRPPTATDPTGAVAGPHDRPDGPHDRRAADRMTDPTARTTAGQQTA